MTTCREALEMDGVQVLEIHPEGCEFICLGPSSSRTAFVLESLGFWDYTSPLSLFDLRPQWWSRQLDPNDEGIFLVMGDPNQGV